MAGVFVLWFGFIPVAKPANLTVSELETIKQALVCCPKLDVETFR
jgi:hypothetical protein